MPETRIQLGFNSVIPIWLNSQDIYIMTDAVGDGSTDDTAAIEAALNAAQPYVLIPEPSVAYKVTGEIVLDSVPAGKHFIGLGNRPTIKLANSSNSHIFGMYGLSHLMFTNFTFDGNKANNSTGACCAISGCNNVVFNHCLFKDAKSQGLVAFSSSHDIKFFSCESQGHDSHAFDCQGLTNSLFDDIYIHDIDGFGILLKEISHDNIVRNLRGVDCGLEVWITKPDSYRNVLDGCIVTGSGDNGISCDGNYCTISNILSYENANHGIGMYGSFNTGSNIVVKNNNQSAGSHSGLSFISNFGGMGSRNVFTNVVAIDDQVSATQTNGVYLSARDYPQWTNGGAYNISNEYCYYLNNVYRINETSSGNFGTVAPVHTTGSQNDGTTDLVFHFTGDGATNTLDTENNVVTNVITRGNVTTGVTDDSGNSNTVTSIAA